ncbi:MAG: HDOD domain-containing protein [Propionivibrio sp.]|uniref:HDOD domain-containing protein n=1 Tax=Propionivibrio sp. TaxID=2212460 RepID=UPI001A49A2A8|nr:HDOD domain-containing protein [Propionivibrio sp.]MBL8414711.1 HDOD domain-containing protein [Propionivibrio sp.]
MNTSRESSPDTGQEADKATEDKKVVENVADKVGEALNAQRFQMLEDIARELAGEVVFPTSFEAAIRLRKALLNSNLPIPRIASIVSVEPLVAAKLIHLANSVLYSPDGTPARDLQAAISRLGVNLVRTTALAIAMSQLMRSKEMAIFTDFTQALWAHTLKTAAAARILARTQTRINPDEALLAGLVHDLGAFYMLYRAAQYPELRTRPETVKYLIIQWHEGIGVTLLNALGIPEDIVNATIDHEQPRAAPESMRTLADIVYVGNILAGTHFERLYQDLDPDAGEAGIIRQKYADLLPEIETETQEMQAIFA